MPENFEQFNRSKEVKEQETVEEQIDRLLGSLPNEIATGWEKKNENLELNDQLRSLESLIEARNKTRETPKTISMVETPRNVKVEHVYPLAIENLIKKIEESDHVELGVGKAGRVVASLRNPHVCYKVMFPIEQLPEGTNSIADEADLQAEVAALGLKNGVRAPQIHAFVENEQVRAIMMEALDAVSIRDLIDGKEPWPESFSDERFFESLTSFVELMHDHNIYHRDLHEGNVMIDRETGMPRIIDFGYSRKAVGDENPYRSQYIRAGQKKELVLGSDEGCIRGLKALVRQAHSKERSL